MWDGSFEPRKEKRRVWDGSCEPRHSDSDARRRRVGLGRWSRTLHQPPKVGTDLRTTKSSIGDSFHALEDAFQRGGVQDTVEPKLEGVHVGPVDAVDGPVR